MQALLRISKAIDGFNRRLAAVVSVLTLGMVAVGAFNAIARYVERGTDLQLASNSYIELQWYFFSLVFLLGAPYALRAGAHVRVDVIYGHFSRRVQAWIDLLGALILLIPFCIFATVYSIEYALESWRVWETSSDPGGLARYPIKTVIPIAFILVGLQGASETIKRIALLRGFSAEEVGLKETDALAAGEEGSL